MNIADAEDAWLEGSIDFEECQEEFEREWWQPVGETVLQMLWQNIPDEVHAELARRVPDAHEQMRQMLEGATLRVSSLRGGYSRA
jgi:hypothetical protein